MQAIADIPAEIGLKPMKIIFGIVFTVVSFQAYAQKFLIKNSQTSFFSSAPLENIEAKSKDLKGVIDFGNGDFSFRCPIRSFKFRSELMEEHFNETYLQSDKFPNATFKGNIEGKYDYRQEGLYPVDVVGVLTIHGVSRNLSIPSNILVSKLGISIQSKFIVKLSDYGIDIPTIVSNKIAEEVEVRLNGMLEPIK
jgi:hypothetical protein